MTTLQSTDDQLTLTDWLAQQDRRARGIDTFDEALDKARLDNQSLRLVQVMRSGEWFTFSALQQAGVPGQQPSISARIREVRRWLEETAQGTIARRQHPNAPRGLFQYQIVMK